MHSTFDLNDLVDADVPAEQDAPQDAPIELEQWAEAQAAIGRGTANPIIFDIETGPRPREEIQDLYTAPPAMGPFDPATVKVGNLGEVKAQEKIAKARSEWEAALKNEAATAERARLEWLDKAALSPTTGRVLLIGTLIGGKPWFLDGPDEAANLTAFWTFAETLLADKTPMIGHNSNAFDLPFLVKRSWFLGVTVPREVRQGRYWNPLFRDTMETWNCGAREFVRLNALGKFFGVGQKTEGVNGGDFAKLWFGEMPADQWGTPAEQRAKALEYNGRDLELTAAVAEKMGMM